MQKKNLFLSITAVVAASAVAYAAKLAADEIKKNGLQPTVDKARTGATNMLDKAKGSALVTNATNELTELRNRFSGSNDNERPFTGGEAGDWTVPAELRQTAEDAPTEASAAAA